MCLHLYYWGLIWIVISWSVASCPLADNNQHLSSKRSLEKRLESALSPLERLEIDPSSTVQRVPQDLPGESDREEWVLNGGESSSSKHEKKYSTFPYNDYLIWMRSGECPQREEGIPEFFCPSPDSRTGLWRCVTDSQLCDQMRDCPNGEDEMPVHCLFYHVLQSHVTQLTQSLIWRARERGI